MGIDNGPTDNGSTDGDLSNTPFNPGEASEPFEPFTGEAKMYYDFYKRSQLNVDELNRIANDVHSLESQRIAVGRILAQAKVREGSWHEENNPLLP